MATGSVLIIVQTLFKKPDIDQVTVQSQPDQNHIRTSSQPDQNQVSVSFTCLCLHIKTPSECREGGTFPVRLSLCLSLCLTPGSICVTFSFCALVSLYHTSLSVPLYFLSPSSALHASWIAGSSPQGRETVEPVLAPSACYTQYRKSSIRAGKEK